MMSVGNGLGRPLVINISNSFLWGFMKRSYSYLAKTRAKALLSVMVAILFSGVFVSLPASAQSLIASVDRNSVSLDETLTLSIRYYDSANLGRSSTQPDISLLSSQFELLSQTQSNQYKSINGQVQAFTEWTIVILPRKTGKLVIPSFKLNGQFSEAIEVSVSDKAPLPSGAHDKVFLETIVEASSTYVQEQIKLTFRFNYAVNVAAVDREPLALDNVIIEELPESKYRRNINGTTYDVIEINYALFPQKSGDLEIPSTRWTAKVAQNSQQRAFGFGGGRFELKRLQTSSKALQILPQPDSFPTGSIWLPSSEVRLVEKWSQDLKTFKVGEPITRTVTLAAKGLMASQLPDILSEPSDSRLKYYPDQPELNNRTESSGIIGIRQEAVAVVVSEGGEITVPSIKVPWWDVKNHQLRYAEIPERRFIVAASDSYEKSIQAREDAIQNNVQLNNDSKQTQSQAPVDSTHRYWVWLCFVFGFFSLIFFGLWWTARRSLKRLRHLTSLDASNAQKHSHNNSEKKCWNEFSAACKNSNDYKTVQKSLLSWAQCWWQDKSLSTLQDIGVLASSESVTQHLRTFDCSMYGKKPQAEWPVTELYSALSQWRALNLNGEAQQSKSHTTLEPFYPQ